MMMKLFILILKALADDGRVRVLKLLLERDLCVGALARELEMSEPAVSQHLRKLRECGLVTGEKRGYWTHYVVNGSLLLEISQEFASLSACSRPAESTCSRKTARGECCCPAREKNTGLLDLRNTAFVEKNDG
jgi:ArsR family transcriptional regulator, arsenate/arsenite/antimonite-responsive transcriptional repressor